MCLAILSSIASTAIAQSVEESPVNFERKGKACVKEICLGDGIDKLKKIKWKKVEGLTSPTMKKQIIAGSLAHYKGNLEASWVYLHAKQFDSNTLKTLHQVKAVCNGFSKFLIGEYISEGGNPTRIEIMLIPTSFSGNAQEWKVSSIQRRYPKAVSEQQRASINSKLKKKYAAFDYKQYMITSAKNGDPQFTGSGRGFILKARFSSSLPKLYSLYPACGGREEINID